MRLSVTRKTVLVEGRFQVKYSVSTDLCIWSGTGMDSFGRYLWRGFELPDKDGIKVFNITELGVFGR